MRVARPSIVLLCLSLCLSLAAALVGAPAAVASPQAGPEAVSARAASPDGRGPGERLIHDRQSATVRFDEALGAAAMGALVAGHGLEVIGSLPALGAVQVIASDGRPIGPRLAALRREARVRYAEPAVVLQPADLPDDPYLPEQWGLDAVRAGGAWELEHASFGVIIAVVDTGVDGNHPDLRPKLLPGWDFYDGDASPADPSGHGTMVAGIAAAATHNGLGAAGMSWGAEILPVRVLGPLGGTDQTVADGIVYAVDRGARVINLSLGGDTPSPLLSDAVTYATDRGAVVVAATGNGGAGSISYPARYPKTIAVGAVAQASGGSVTVAAYSNYGPNIDLVAPGSQVLGTRPGGGYGYGDGTSFAAPFVSGLAALVLSRDPRLSAAQVSTRLRNTARDLGAAGYDERYGAGLIDADAALHATADPGASDARIPSLAVRGVQPGTWASGSVTVAVQASDPGGVSQADLDFAGRIQAFGHPATFDTGFMVSTSWDTTRSPDGLRTWTARAVDPAGLVRTTTIPVLVANDHALARVGRTVTTGGPGTALSYRTLLAQASPFVYRATTDTSARLTLSLLREDGATVATASGARSVYLARSSVPAGSYRVRLTSSVASTTVTLSGAWYR